MGVAVNVVAPLGASPHDLMRIPQAHANICLYPEVAGPVCDWLKRNFKQPCINQIPLGVSGTESFLDEVAETLNIDRPAQTEQSRLPWYSRSVDSTYLTGKRVFVFGDATHAVGAARIASKELAFEVVGLGTYSREQARSVRSAASELGLSALITDNYLEVEQAISELQPELVLGTQMERHIAKRLGIPCAVISTPAHVQDYPARYSPQMGFEGANVIFDTWVHPLMMGLEEHLLAMFRDDFEFNDGAQPSHLAAEGVASRSEPGAAVAIASAEGPTADAGNSDAESALAWDLSAERELRKIPFFVRGKARRNTERFAAEQGVSIIKVDTLYEAKAHFSR
jgi:light-independent protochlorophyllide reductase subunit B